MCVSLAQDNRFVYTMPLRKFLKYFTTAFIKKMLGLIRFNTNVIIFHNSIRSTILLTLCIYVYMLTNIREIRFTSS